MTHSTRNVQYTPYGEDRFPAHLPFGPVGYLFTVPGSVPADTPAHTNVTDSLMAVYRTHEGWEVRDVNGMRRVWAEARTRREAVGMAFLEIARYRRQRAAEIAEDRVKALGLEPVPPYMVETTHRVTFVLDPAEVGILHTTKPAEFDPPGTAAHYYATSLRAGHGPEVPADGPSTLHPVVVGVLHARCGHDPDDAAHCENEQDATVYAREALTAWWPCPDNPTAPEPPEHPALAHAQTAAAGAWPCVDTRRWSAAGELQAAADEDQAIDVDVVLGEYEQARDAAFVARTRAATTAMAVIARTIRSAYPNATDLSVSLVDCAVTAIFVEGSVVWTAQGMLPGAMHFELINYLADLLTFWRDTEDLTQLAWAETTDSGVFTVPLPPRT